MYRVEYNIKHIKKNSSLYGYLTTETCIFPNVKDAFDFARKIRSKKSKKVQVIGMPLIEQIYK
jgi:hypothetical protein